MEVNLTSQAIFYFLGSIFFVVMTVLLGIVLWRLVRILGRIDTVSEDIKRCVGSASHVLEELRKKAIVSGLALAIEKLVKSKKSKK